MLAGRDLGLRNINAVRADERHDPLSYVDGRGLEVRHDHGVGIDDGTAECPELQLQI